MNILKYGEIACVFFKYISIIPVHESAGSTVGNKQFKLVDPIPEKQSMNDYTSLAGNRKL